MKKFTSLLILVLMVAISNFVVPAAASNISKGIPGLKWGDSIKNAKGYTLQHCGEPEIKGEPSFYTIFSPADFKLVGISSKSHNAWTQPILWTYKNRLMGVQFDLTSTDKALSTLLDFLGSPSKKVNNSTRLGIYEWKIKGTVLVKGIDVRNGYMVQVYHLPTLNKLNQTRKTLGMVPWD
ncbi:MAG: hypothetical protein GXX92_12720 [Clostridiales bacterium]|nr:hypothetical protein [Clostridiales bacterium]